MPQFRTRHRLPPPKTPQPPPPLPFFFGVIETQREISYYPFPLCPAFPTPLIPNPMQPPPFPQPQLPPQKKRYSSARYACRQDACIKLYFKPCSLHAYSNFQIKRGAQDPASHKERDLYLAVPFDTFFISLCLCIPFRFLDQNVNQGNKIR